MIYYLILYVVIVSGFLIRSRVDLLSPLLVVFLFGFSITGSLFFDKTFVNGNLADYFLMVVALLALIFFPSIYQARRTKSFTIENTSARLNAYKLSKNQVIWIYLIFTTSILSYIYLEFYSQAIRCVICAELSSEIKSLGIEKAHRLGKDSKFQIIASQVSVFGALVFYHSISIFDKKPRKLCLLFSLLPFALAIIKSSKSDLFFCAITYGAVLYYLKLEAFKAIRRFVVCSAALIVLLFVASINMRVSALGGDYSELISYKGGGVLEAPLYGYTAGSIDNFILYLQKYNYPIISDNFGSSALRPFLSVLFMGGYADSLVQGESSFVLGAGATVGTYMRSLTHEGGLIWLLMMSTFYGGVLTAIYARFVKSGSVVFLAMYSVLLIPWLMLPFQNLYANLNIWFSLILLAPLGFFKKTHK